MPASSEPATEEGPELASASVVMPKHLHARPAGQLAQLAARHKANTIEVQSGEKKVNARSVLAVMALGAVSGTDVHVTVSGPDAEAVTAEVVDILLEPEE